MDVKLRGSAVGDGSGIKLKTYKETMADMVDNFIGKPDTVATHKIIEEAAKQIQASFGKPDAVWITPTFLDGWQPIPFLKAKDKPAYDFCEVARKLDILESKELDRAAENANNVHKRYLKRQKTIERSRLKLWEKRKYERV